MSEYKDLAEEEKQAVIKKGAKSIFKEGKRQYLAIKREQKSTNKTSSDIFVLTLSLKT